MSSFSWPGRTDDPAKVAGVADFATSLPAVERVDVLPLHRTGRRGEVVVRESLEGVRRVFRHRGVRTA